MGRFLNADSYTSTGQGLLGNNMFAYCNNSPVVFRDSEGNTPETIWDIISLAASVVDVIANPSDPWAWFGLAGDILDVIIPCFGGTGELIDALKGAGRIIDKGDDIVDTAKQAYRAADTSDLIKKSKGTYVVMFETGQNYVGKGGFKRAIDSAEEHFKEGGKVMSLIWMPATSDTTAFVSEYLLQSVFGVGDDALNNFNKIWSPGRKKLPPLP